MTRWHPLAAATVVAAVALGAITVAATRASHSTPGPTPPAAAATTVPAAVGGPLAPVDTILRDGDRVHAGPAGIVAVPGRPVRLCASDQAGGRVGGPENGGLENVPAYCEVGLTLVGADLHRLAGAQEHAGTVWGSATIDGVYRAGTVTVTGQDLWHVRAGPWTPPPFPADCRPPAGGWPRHDVQNRPGIGEAGQYVATHATELGADEIGYPEPVPSGKIGTQVLIVGTTGDVRAATTAIRRFYRDSLCVRAVAHTRAEMRAARVSLDAVIADPAQRVRYGLEITTGELSVGGDPRAGMPVLAYTAAVDGLRRQLGSGVLDPEPVLRKIESS